MITRASHGASILVKDTSTLELSPALTKAFRRVLLLLVTLSTESQGRLR
ncbi:hypothetical protein BQ8420_22710 [Nocardiopsis sp. JB363]|nr:hypothetical protein BQ8420_22710 [Nocardiopsis sp. JB363]